MKFRYNFNDISLHFLNYASAFHYIPEIRQALSTPHTKTNEEMPEFNDNEMLRYFKTWLPLKRFSISLSYIERSNLGYIF